MPAEIKKEIELEIGHVLFIDIVGYSKLLIDEQRDYLHTLNEVVRRTDSFRAADAAGKLTRLPTGDGMALVFATTPDAPVSCAIEISNAPQPNHSARARGRNCSRNVANSGLIEHCQTLADFVEFVLTSVLSSQFQDGKLSVTSLYIII